MSVYIFLVLGFIILIGGANFLVEGGAAVAKRFNVSNLVIGLTIVAFGTSAPEFIVTLFASIGGASDLAIANIVGSVVTNILLGLGIAAIIYPLSVRRGTVWKEIPLSLLAIMVLIILANDQWVIGGGIPQLSWTDGIALLSFFGIFMYYTFGISKAKADDTVPEEVKDLSNSRSIVYIVLGIGALFLGGKWIVDSATVIAAQLGVSQTLIGLIVTGPGTSLPELAATVIAARKKNVDMAVGGVIGSNIFNIFLILGASAAVGSLAYDPALNIDLLLIFGASVLLFATLFIGKRHHIERWQGVGFLVMYVIYLGHLFYRG